MATMMPIAIIAANTIQPILIHFAGIDIDSGAGGSTESVGCVAVDRCDGVVVWCGTQVADCDDATSSWPDPEGMIASRRVA